MADLERIERELREGLDMLSSWQATKPVSNFSILHKMTIGDLRALLDELARRAEIIERAKEVIRPFAEIADMLPDRWQDHETNWPLKITDAISVGDLRTARIFLSSLEPTHAE